jgi:hypothetical protein
MGTTIRVTIVAVEGILELTALPMNRLESNLRFLGVQLDRAMLTLKLESGLFNRLSRISAVELVLCQRLPQALLKLRLIAPELALSMNVEAQKEWLVVRCEKNDPLE